MSLENERQKCQLPSCENRMSIKDRVLKILVSDYIELFSPTVSPQLRFAVPAVSVYKSYDTSGHWMVSILHTQVDIKYRRKLTKPFFRKNFF